jgi:hypothetical protein
LRRRTNRAASSWWEGPGDAAESLPGPAAVELADLVGDVMREAWERIETLMSEQS